MSSEDRSSSPEQELAAAWERRKGETGAAYGAFVLYRDLGARRRLQQVAEARGCQVSLLKRWSSEYDWVCRARAWDAEQAREQERLRRELRREALEQQAQDAELLRKLCRGFLQGLVQRDAETGRLHLDPSIKPRDAVQFYRLASEIEKGLPQPAEPEAADDGTEALAPLSTEEVRQLLAEVQRQMEGGADDDSDDGSVAAA